MILAYKRDYYDILGVSRTAKDNDIKKAYRKLAKKYHPDMNPGDGRAEQRFKEITEAYDVLSDPEKKKLYDRFGYAAFDGTEAGADQRHRGQYQEFHFTGGDAGDIFEDIFGTMFHGKYTGGFSQKGEDITAEITVSFDEAVSGCDKIVHLSQPDSIRGGVQTLKVHIPAGIETGKTIRLQGKGMPGIHGGASGDLLLQVTVEEKHGFLRKGNDVYTKIQIPFTTAVFGGEVVVQTLYGNVLCKIQGGTQSGTKIRLKGKGIVSMSRPSVYGDQYVTVQIQVPQNLNARAKQKLKEFQKAC